LGSAQHHAEKAAIGSAATGFRISSILGVASGSLAPLRQLVGHLEGHFFIELMKQAIPLWPDASRASCGR
jgi:hypothetical protein